MTEEVLGWRAKSLFGSDSYIFKRVRNRGQEMPGNCIRQKKKTSEKHVEAHCMFPSQPGASNESLARDVGQRSYS